MNKFTPLSKQWSALFKSLLFSLFLLYGFHSANAQCPDCAQDTLYNMSFDGFSCEKIVDYDDFNIDTTGCGSDYVLLVTDVSMQDTLVFGLSDTITYAYVRDTLSFSFYIEGQVDTCNGSIVLCDTIQPVLSIQDSFTFVMPDDSCMTDVPLPTDTISDNCGDPTVTIYAPGVDTLYDTDTLRDVMDGTYTVMYELTDSCTAPVRDTMILEVEGTNDPPTLVCDQNNVTTYTNMPFPVGASTFVDTATDDCGMNIYYKVRKMDDPTDPDCLNPDNPDNLFDDEVTICCDDIPSVMVVVRAYDRNPGPGPISEDTLAGHFSTCMVAFDVDDKTEPTLEAPTDLSIVCGTTYDINDLSAYGDIALTPSGRDTFMVNGQEVIDGIVDDNCPGNIELNESVQLDTNLCGLGTIRRIFTATDSGGLTAIDTQIILIAQEELFDEDNIVWPSDTVIYDCSPYPVPDSMGYPAIDTSLECTMIGWHYTDKLFNLQSGCYKILRQWTVIDWCQNDPNEQDDDWKFMYDQVIKVNDTVPPAFPVLDTISIDHMDPECEPVQVTIPPVDATDCSFYPALDYTVGIDYDDDGLVDTTYDGNDASGEYPNGTHRVIYTAEDDCGNVGQAERIVEVIDRKPPDGTVTSIISVNMSSMNGVPMVTVPAGVFNPSGGSMDTLQDNCTSNDNLRFSYSPDINDDALTVDCDAIGDTILTIYVWDEAGNSASVLATLRVTDTDSLCPQGSIGATIAGHVTVSGLDQSMSGVEVTLEQGDQSWTTHTGSDGHFEFDQMTTGNDYSIRTSYEEDYLNGISTYDLVLIQRHILGIKNFDDAHQYVAADVDNNRQVSATDMVALRRVILGLDDQFSNNHSWRFTPTDFNMNMSPGKPLPELPEGATIHLNSDGAFVSFNAVKVGDLNHSMQMDGLTQVEDRSKETIYLEYENRSLYKGQVQDMAFYAQSGTYFGFQGAIDVDPEYAEVVYAASNALPDFSPRSIRTMKATGETRFSWNQAIPVKFGNAEPVMIWKLRVKKDCELSDIIRLNTESIPNEIYDNQHGLYPLELRKRNGEISESDRSLQFEKIYPNPFEDITYVDFHAAEKGSLEFRVINAYGEHIFSKEYAFKQGSNHLQINLKDLSIPGLLYYQLECDKQVITGKLIKARR